MSVLETLVTDLQKEFELFGIKTDEDNVIDKICEFCLANRVSAENFVSSWMAFTVSNKLAKPKPTMQLIEQLINKEFNESNKKSRDEWNEQTDYTELNELDEDDAEKLLEAYGTPVVKAEALKRQITPINHVNKRRLGRALEKSPTVYSPESVSSPENKFHTRNNAGEIVLSFGKTKDIVWKNDQTEKDVTIKPYDDSSSLQKPYLYMYEKIPTKARFQNQWLEDFGFQLSKTHGLQLVSPSETFLAEKHIVLGKIWTDGLGKLKANQLLMEGPLDDSKSTCLRLDVSEMTEYSFFPGQLLAVEGINYQDRFMVEKIYSGDLLPFSQCVTNSQQQNSSPLQIIVAIGPFTTTDDCSYSPLIELINYVEKHQPDVCILIGPFVDSKADILSKYYESHKFEMCSYDDVFQFVISIVSDRIKSLKTQIIIVPSLRDAHHSHFVYPTAPFTAPTTEKGLHFFSDPCVLDVNGVVIGMTSVDILFHLAQNELASPGSTDRLGRFARQILKQQNFYPLRPPHQGVNIDYTHFEVHAMLPVTPDILILPSHFKYFIKDIDGCCCINPERLVKGLCGGTFVRIQADPSRRVTRESIIDSIVAEVIKI